MQQRPETIFTISKTPLTREHPPKLPNEIFGSHVFHEGIQREVLSPSQFRTLQTVIREGTELTQELAGELARAIKEWGLERNVTHYCHWFQPLTDLTAEKHDAIYHYDGHAKYLADFNSSHLMRGEPDASSFPTGGLRATFEARGYTGWDPSSPPFVIGRTLIIPSFFMSHTGEALDKKTPLLRALQALNHAAVRALHLLGDTHVKQVTMTVGPEQEYFLIDKRFFFLRPDLISTGRTVFGAPPIKGQELQDQYLGTIPSRVLLFMEDIEYELLQLGIPIVTRHNEVAPAQFELAVQYESANLAVDHQMLTMDILRKSASRHQLACLLHEKPFQGINGSGKHLNWSLATDAGVNLLEPGETPQDNGKFLFFCAAVLHSVYQNAPLLLASIASPGNDHRLGQHEAPPGILSVFLGDQLFKIFHALATGTPVEGVKGGHLIPGVSLLPKIPRHASDRNRTSPFAFTGNKFEFRAPGSSSNVAEPCTMLAAAMANTLEEFADRLEKNGDPINGIRTLIEEVAKEIQPVLFEGDNYDQQWLAEALKRKLPAVNNTVDAAMCLKKSTLLTKMKILTKKEVDARVSIMLSKYITKIRIEAKAATTLAHTMIMPAALRYLKEVSGAAEHIKSRGFDLPTTLADEIVSFSQALEHLDAALTLIPVDDSESAAIAIREHLLPAMVKLRFYGDRLESLVDDAIWPLPKYQEMLFIR